MTKKAIVAGAAIAGLMSGSFAVTTHAAVSTAKAGRFAADGQEARDGQARLQGPKLL